VNNPRLSFTQNGHDTARFTGPLQLKTSKVTNPHEGIARRPQIDPHGEREQRSAPSQGAEQHVQAGEEKLAQRLEIHVICGDCAKTAIETKQVTQLEPTHYEAYSKCSVDLVA
jgi:hypothetical protein